MKLKTWNYLMYNSTAATKCMKALNNKNKIKANFLQNY